MSIDPLEVHKNLMRSLPVRNVGCPETFTNQQDEPARVERRKLPSILNVMQRAEIRERRLLDQIDADTWYSAKHLAGLAGTSEKSFYTHVRRMVDRGQLARRGRRHHFHYRKR